MSSTKKTYFNIHPLSIFSLVTKVSNLSMMILERKEKKCLPATKNSMDKVSHSTLIHKPFSSVN